jgi:serine/threonine protein kinase
MSWTLAGRYRLTGFVASGETGRVWQAVDEGTDRLVAVKLLHPRLAADPRLADRLLRARRALTELWHPGIARLLEVVVTGGEVALVSDFVPGADLARVLARSGPVPPARAARIAATVAAALDSAHGAGVVHGDVKPSNVLVPSSVATVAKVTDFSVATLVRVGRPRAEWVGAARYGAPELFVDGAVPTSATDVHALGIVLYEMLTGTTARSAEADQRVGGRLLEVIEGCVVGDQAARFTADEVAHRLRVLAPELPQTVPRRARLLRPQVPRPEQPPSNRRRQTVTLTVAAAAVVLVAAGATVATVNALTPDPAEEQSPFGTTAGEAQSAPPVPTGATTRSPEGGSEFVRYWFAALTHAARTGDVAGLAEATSPDCQECQGAIDEIETAYQGGGAMRGGEYTVRRVATANLWTEDRPVYEATVERSPRTTVDDQGVPQATLAPLSFTNCQLVLQWTGERWQVLEVVSPDCV